MKRCFWVNLNNKLYVDYHDLEWGVPKYDDHELYELLILEMFQAGLSWETILKKRENFRLAMDNFDYERIVNYDEEKINELMNNKGIIEYKEGFISKIKKFLKNLFKKKKEENDYVAEISNLNDAKITSDQKESEFFNDIKVDTSDIDKYMDKKNFLEYIDGNVEALKMLSVDRLRKLKEYYDGVIENNDKIIENLKKSS